MPRNLSKPYTQDELQNQRPHALAFSFARSRLACQGNAKKPNILSSSPTTSLIVACCYPEAPGWVKTRTSIRADKGIRFAHCSHGVLCMGARPPCSPVTRPTGSSPCAWRANTRAVPTTSKSAHAAGRFQEERLTAAQVGKWHTGTDNGFGLRLGLPKSLEPSRLPGQCRQLFQGTIDPDQRARTGHDPRLLKRQLHQVGRGIASSGRAWRKEGKPFYLWVCYGADRLVSSLRPNATSRATRMPRCKNPRGRLSSEKRKARILT